MHCDCLAFENNSWFSPVYCVSIEGRVEKITSISVWFTDEVWSEWSGVSVTGNSHITQVINVV